MNWNLVNTYRDLPERLFRLGNPTPVREPRGLVWNGDLAVQLGLVDGSQDPGYAFPDGSVEIFAGNAVPPGGVALSQAYAGHQFGYFAMLGDGRACLMGEQIDPLGITWDLQWKGSGPTPYSRGGDGRATTYSMLREFVMSEALHYLGIPTTRCLAVVSTGEIVRREELRPGAIMTRVSRSHIRVGSFECAYRFLDFEDLQALTSYAINRLYPHLTSESNPALALLREVQQAQIRLVVDWMRIGFIHGVMNTDNMSIAGETLDYGPCAFLNAYHPARVFSSIDTQGRYAYGNQPAITHWNLACFANSLLPMIDENQARAVEKAREVLDSFVDIYDDLYWNMLGQKIGFPEVGQEERVLLEKLFQWMQKTESDFTNTFLAMEGQWEGGRRLPKELWGGFENSEFGDWISEWKTLLLARAIPLNVILENMQNSNPTIIPRNHLVESFLEAGENGSVEPMLEWMELVKDPYTLTDVPLDFLSPPIGGDGNYRTFCGT